MSLARGIQSAIFHYVSCAPCTGYAYRKKRRKEAKRDRIQRQREMEMRSPDEEEVYQHPDPSHTNPFWEEEIALGPGPPKRRGGGKRKDSSKIERTNTAMSGSTGESKRSLGSRTAGSSLEAVIQGAVLIDSVRTSIEELGENWNRKRYQREDEELWGFGEIPQSRSGSARQRSVAGSSTGISGASRPGTAYSSTGSYYIARAPPVNDLHPPVVSLLSPNVGSSRWMLQPPPKAAVQMGRERPMTRNRSDSGGQSSKTSLHKQVSEKKLREMMQQGEIPAVPIPPPVSRPGSKPGSFRKQKRERDNQQLTLNISNSSNSLQSSKALTMQHRTASNRSRRSLRTPADSSDSDSSSEDAPYGTPSNRSPYLKPISANATSGPSRTRPTRPKLSPVVSQDSRSITLASQKPARERTKEDVHNPHDSTSPSMSPTTTPPTTGSTDGTHFSTPSKEEKRPKRHPLSISDYSSLNALQDKVTQRDLLDLKIDTNLVYEAGIRLPPADKTEEILLSDDEWVRGRNSQKRWSVGF